jgi:hypothetical protein
MNKKIFCLNCQKAYNSNFNRYLPKVLELNFYDFLLFQEADEKVLSIIQGAGNYKILGSVNPDNQMQSHLHVLYRDGYKLETSTFISFAKMNRLFARRAELGFLLGVFDCEGEKIIIGSVHLHPGFSFYLRMKEMGMVKNHLLAYSGSKVPIIFGGDFNLGFPWECAYARKTFGLDFFDATKNIGPTLNSRYTEKGTHIASRIGNIFAWLGIGIVFETDRIFINKEMVKQSKLTARILQDRVSDHSPLEFTIEAVPADYTEQ